MENKDTWDWNNGDARIISSVYRDAETKAAKVKPIEGKTAETAGIKEESVVEAESQNEKAEQVENIEENSAKAEHQSEKIAEIINIEEKPAKAESQNEKAMESENIKAAAAESGTTQGIETSIIKNQPTEAPQVDNANPVNAFILVDEPKSSAPEKEAPFTQPQFQPVVLSQNRQQEHGEKRQRSAQGQSTNFQSNYSEKDISENKIAAMAAYLLGWVGIIIALLMSAESPYAKFHVRQALKLTVCSVVLEIFAAVFALFGMIPFVGIIFKLMLVLTGAAWLGVLVLRLIAIVQVCDGEAREPAVISSFRFF